MDKIVHLDYGHGGHDSGALGHGLKEKDIVLSIGKKVTDILKAYDIKVTHSRTSDVFVDLLKRSQIANKSKADIFVSLHCNSFSNADAQGLEIYSYPGSGAGRLLAKNILDSIVNDKLYSKNRGLKNSNFSVLRNSNMPACLVELGFITNYQDVNILTNKQNKLAIAVAKGILNNIGIAYKDSGDDSYYRAIESLIKNGIIATPEAWSDPDKIKPANAKALIIKVAGHLNQEI